MSWYESRCLMPRRITTLAFVCAAGCGAVKDAVGDFLDDGGENEVAIDMEGGASDRLDVPATAPDVATDVGTPVSTAPLSRSDRKYPFPAKGGSNVGFRIDALVGTYALTGTVQVPEWSAENEGDPAVVRDDDLDTAWTCKPRGADRCAIGIRFPQAATLEAVQVFAAGGPRPKRLRIHTDEGHIDALLPDENTHVYAVFGKDIVSSWLAIEVMEVWGGGSSTIQIAELEVFGSSGDAREPIAIDPDRTWVRFEEPVWSRGARNTYNRATAFVHHIDAQGKSHRFVEGTAVRGKAGDRLLLIERLQSVTGCDAPRGTFYLLDTHTRLIAPLGEFGGVGGDVFRAKDGLGVAVGYVEGNRTVLDGLFVGDGSYHRKRTPLRADKRGEDFLDQWGLDHAPVVRGATPLANSSCSAGTEDALADLMRVRPSTGKKGKAEAAIAPEQWRVCELVEGARAFLTDRGPCGSAWEIYVLDAKGGLVGIMVQQRSGAHLGLRDLGGGTLLVQAGGNTDAVSLVRVDAAGVDTLADSAALVLEPPAECRSVCDAGFRNPHAPE
jgi:hypothetical protein